MPATFGTQVISTAGGGSAAIGKSGDPIRVVSAQVTSGGTASVLSLYNGTAASGTPLWQGAGTINETTTPATFPAGGLYFPSGCFASYDAQGNGCNIQYELITSIP